MHNILILGSGGREHAFAWKLKQSQHCSKLYIAPGNAGTAQLGKNVSIAVDDFASIRTFLMERDITMLVVGPEVPLVKGIYDFVKSDKQLQHIIVVGPSAEGAKLEGSKAYAKAFMEENNIPTAAYLEVTSQNIEKGYDRINQSDTPIVLKADGLAAGKGVLIINDKAEAKHALREMLGGQFGTASQRVVIEDFLDGIEFSVFVLTDGNDYKILPVAKDYKRIGEGDTGLNTGGMGAVSPVPFVDNAMMKKVEEEIIVPTIRGIQKRQITYKGFIFLGLINVAGTPKVIEYNCRMGDPETEAVLPRIASDLVPLLATLDSEGLGQLDIKISSDAAATIVLVSEGYPGYYPKGLPIQGVDTPNDCLIFHAGTKHEGGQLLTNGGRVIAVTGIGKSREHALAKAKKGASDISFQGKYNRTDIGLDLID